MNIRETDKTLFPHPNNSFGKSHASQPFGIFLDINVRDFTDLNSLFVGFVRVVRRV